jgi:hypothetical protein
MRTLLVIILASVSFASVQAQVYSADEFTRRTIERRAIEAVNWGIPAVNTDRMVQALKSASGDWNQIIYFPKLQSWKNQTLTPTGNL